MISPDGTNWGVNIGLILTLIGFSAVIFYWAATTKNDVENNPDN